MLMTLFDLLMTAYQGSLTVYALKTQTSQQPHHLLGEAAAVMAYVLFYVIIQSFHLPVPEALSAVIFFVYAKLTSDESLLRCIFWAVLDTFLSLGTLTLVSSMFDMQIAMNGNVLSASEDAVIIYYFVGNAAVTVVMSITIRLSRAAHEPPRKEMPLFVAMLAILFIINECFFVARLSGHADPSLLLGAFCAFAGMLLVMVLYERLTALNSKQRQAERAAQTAQLVAEHQEELKGIYQHMLAVQHDLRHCMAAAEEMLSSPDLSAAQRHEALSLLQSPSQPRLFFTGCLAVDALLRAKTIIMENAGISFALAEQPLTPLPIPERDFCMLLGNLLDNAIEGVLRLPAHSPSRKIRLSFSRIWDVLLITCVNDAHLASIKRRGDTFLSSKDRSELHGFGIQSMRGTVEKAGGSIEFHVGRDQFTVEIMLGSAPAGSEAPSA